MGRSGSPSKSRMAQRGEPRARPGPAAGNLQDLPEVEVAVDALERSGAGAFEPAEETVQRLLRNGPTASAGLGPGLADALGYSRSDVLARRGFGGCAQCLGEPAVHGGRRRAQRVGFGGEPDPPAGRVHGEPPGIESAGEEFVRHSEFAARRDGQWQDGRIRRLRPGCGRRRLPLAGHPAKGCRDLRGAPGRQRRADFDLGVLAFGQHPEELHDGGCAAVSSSTITELFDCSPESTLTLPVANGRR